jgi:ketosteroid isomerase-like protein
MRSRLALFLVGTAALAACSNQQAPAPPPTVDLAAARVAIAAANKAWDANYLKGDAAAVAAIFTEDAANYPPGKPTIRGRAAIEADIKAELDSTKYTASVDTTDELMAAGEYVVEIGSWSSKGTFKSGKPTNEGGRWMAVWKRDSTGAWKTYRVIGNHAPTKP